MAQNTCTLTQAGTNPPCGSVVLALLILVCGSRSMAQAATIPFTFSISADASVVGSPSLATPTLPTTVSGSGSFVPFGSAIYSEAGTVTYMMLPSGTFVPSSVMNTFVASFNGATNTFAGTDSVSFGAPNAMGLPTFSNTLTILSGTGIFSDASGSATATGTANPPAVVGQPTPVSFSGSGQITAPGLSAIPEPASMMLLGIAMASLSALAAIRKKRRDSTAG
jgi:PEP-CTERM motif-containing protein